MLISNEQKRFYEENGYLVIKRGIDPRSLKEAQDAALRVVEKCASGSYPFCRADTRLSDKFIEKIDHIFHPDIFEPEIFKAVVDSNIVQYAKDAMGHQDVFASFYRMHPTMGFSTWSAWHRDDLPDGRDYTIKATLPLFPECGFYVVPGSHKKGDTTINTNTTIKGKLEGEVCVAAEAGDILLFHTAIAHRGSCAGRNKFKRAQVHFRFTATAHADKTPRVEDTWSTRPEMLALADDAWRDVLTKQISAASYKVTKRVAPVHGAKSKGRQLLARAFYYLSALLPRSHPWISEPPKGFVPYVRIPKQYRWMYKS